MIHPTAKMSEEVNMKCCPMDTTVQLSTPYTDPECHSALQHRLTDDGIVTIADHTVCSNAIG